MQTKAKSGSFDIRWNRFELALSKRTYIMGILNRTPDSFSDGGLFMDAKDAIKRAHQMISEGADIIDIGGESTRPGAEPVSTDEEIARVIPVIEAISKSIDIPISIDTYKAGVAAEAMKAGAAIINDVTALTGDPDMAGVAAKFDVPVVLMHMKGRPKTMQQDINYGSLIEDIIDSLRRSIDLAVRAGVDSNKIIVDPGIGFGKTVEHNFEILNRLEEFKVLDKPILVGASRKSFITKTLAKSGVSENDIKNSDALMGGAACAAISIAKSASILRVHDVKEMVEVARIADAVNMAAKRHGVRKDDFECFNA
ncbi:MAG: dihydropteroate synthase [Candidatus Omnitrophica bacterium]|nr:dihydropteroate synthase [Candidatus Omnitrophota bacterium]MBU4487576.1 dihydropteroate synthase [Candidatus Omnitrophota bacterium]MCG2705592.1 dihydropteroate synthase [Candidatus Omnitrophota bacterium]